MSAVTSSGISMPELVRGAGGTVGEVAFSRVSVIATCPWKSAARPVGAHRGDRGPMVPMRPGDPEIVGLDRVLGLDIVHARGERRGLDRAHYLRRPRRHRPDEGLEGRLEAALPAFDPVEQADRARRFRIQYL